MNVLIVEDETAAATNLKALLLQIDPSIRIEAVIETVVETVRWVRDNPLPDLIFMDIHLADGQAFKIFEQIDIECPIVFTTAYDRYALDAFKVNSIDYILKPIKKEELRRAFDKLRRLSAPQVAEYVEQTNRFVASRSRGFLIPFRDKLVPLTPEEIAYFHTSDERVSVATLDGRTASRGRFLPRQPAVHRVAPGDRRPVGLVRQSPDAESVRQDTRADRNQQGARARVQALVRGRSIGLKRNFG